MAVAAEVLHPGRLLLVQRLRRQRAQITDLVEADPDAGTVTPATSKAHQRLYGRRQDTESPNAQLERAFYGQRLPAWGVHNQTTVVLLVILAENAWVRHAWVRQVWYDEAEHQRQRPAA